MSKSPHRFRGDAAECWRYLVAGEIMRVLDAPLVVADVPAVKLPKSGHWESGLAKVRPALDDSLGSTAFALAWRFASARADANAWPSIEDLATRATDHPIVVDPKLTCLARRVRDGLEVTTGGGKRSWTLELPDGPSTVGVTLDAENWTQVDLVADAAAAWFDVAWSVEFG